MSGPSFFNVTIDLLTGFLDNLELFGLTLLFSLPLGLIVTFGSMSKFKPLAWFTKVFVWIIRGTPLMLQSFVVYYVPGLVFDMPMRERMLAAIIAFVINYSCYFSEIYRGGIESISKGQYEAGLAEDAAARVAELVEGGMSRKDAIKQTAKELDLPKNVVYDAALQ